MSYIVPIHRPSGVRHAIKLRFLESNDDALIVAKANRLEVYSQGREGLVLVHTRSVYGYITMLERLRPASSKTDHLFVGTDRYQYFTCSWDPEAKQIKTEQSYVDQADKTLRDTRESDRCHIDSSGRFMTLELYDGVVTVVPIVQSSVKKQRRDSSSGPPPEVGSLGEPTQVRIEELQTRSSAFLDMGSDVKNKNPRLAILWEDNSDTPQLKLRELQYFAGGDQPSTELKTVAELNADLDQGVSHLVPVPEPYGGFLILGERSICYVDSDLRDVASQDLEDNATIWSCWTRIDDQRWLLADDYGRLFFLMIETNFSSVVSWKLDSVGTASKASCLVYLDEGFVFVGSHSGDSQVVQIVEGGVEVVQKFENIAPILDFSIMDLGRGAEGGISSEFSSGQARIVTASGAWQDGSIRSVRSGVGMEELGTIGQIAHITDLWPLSSTGTGDEHDTLLAVFVNETRIFRFDAEAAVEEVENFCNLELSQPTVYAANLPDRKIVQVHESGVRICDLESGMLTLQWQPQDQKSKITAACANSVHLLVIEGGHTLHVFHTANNESKPTISKTFPSSSQISSVAVPDSQSNICVVSFWQTASVSILDLHSLEVLKTQSLGTPGTAIPRSILVTNLLAHAPPTLFIAMADGTVITYSFDTSKKTLSGTTRILLGTEPVFFKLLPRVTESGAGLTNVFASCEQPSLIYSSEGRIIYSAVNSDKATRVCPFNSAAYPGAIAIATPTELKLAMIGTERSTQLQTLAVNETVRCIAYEPNVKMFGMGCIRRIMEGGTEALLSSVKIADEVNFRQIDEVELKDRELVECIISTGSFEDESAATEYGEMFVVGTSISGDENVIGGEDEPKGRIIVYEISKENKLKQVTDLPLKGACRSLAMCDGKIVAGLVKTIVLYGLIPSTHRRQSLELKKLATYRTSTNPLALSVTPSTSTSPATIAVADLMKSLSVLEVLPPSPEVPEYQLKEVSRHFAVLWSSATTGTDENEWVVADMEGNLVMLRRNASGVTNDDRRRLEVIGEFRLGEIVNKIIPIAPPGSQAQPPLPPPQPKAKDRSRTLSTSTNPLRKTDTNLSTLTTTTSNTTTTNLDRTTSTTDPRSTRTGPLIYPKAFLATVEGSIYMLGTINPAYTNALLLLQSALATRVQAPGYMPWTKFRAWKTEVRESEEPFRFVDGEMLEAGLLALGDGDLDMVLKEGGLGEDGLNVSVDEVRTWAEDLRRLY